MEEENNMPDIKEIKLQIFEKENPEGVNKLKRLIEKKITKTKEEIEKIVEKELDEYFKGRGENVIKPTYIG